MDKFNVGDVVYYKEEPFRPDAITSHIGPGPYKIVKIQPVPPDKFFPDLIGDGGVGHSQWCYIEGHESPISGAWFTHTPTKLN